VRDSADQQPEGLAAGAAPLGLTFGWAREGLLCVTNTRPVPTAGCKRATWYCLRRWSQGDLPQTIEATAETAQTRLHRLGWVTYGDIAENGLGDVYIAVDRLQHVDGMSALGGGYRFRRCSAIHV